MQMSNFNRMKHLTTILLFFLSVSIAFGANIFANRVGETTPTEGTGTVALVRAETGYQTFVSGVGSGNTCDYLIVNSAGQWEMGNGTVTDSAPDTLSRDTVESSSNSDALVNFSAGTKYVYCVLPASKMTEFKAAGDTRIKLSNYTDFATALSTIGSVTETDLWIDEDVTLAADATVTDNITLRVISGNKFYGAYTLTINGPIEVSPIKWYGNSTTVTLSDLIYRIPTDFPTINNAISQLQASSERKTILNIATGHKILTGIDIRGKNCGNIKIISTDAIVYLDATFAGVTVPSYIPTTGGNPIMYVENSVAPVWAILVDAELADSAGLFYRKSTGEIYTHGGVKNANRMGIVISNTSNVMANSSIFTNSGDGNRVTVGSVASFYDADLSNARALTETQAACLDVSRGSVVNMASNTVQYAAGSYADLSGATKFGLNCRRSWVSASNIDLSNAGINAVTCSLGGHVIISSAVATGSGSHTVKAYASTIIANEADLSGSGGRAVYAAEGAFINVTNSDLTNADAEAIFCSTGSNVAATAADVAGFDFGSTGADAVVVYNGSTVSTNGMTGSPTFNVTKNTINAGGIIFN